MKKCPRSGLPPEGDLECHYCGLVLTDEIKSNNFQNKMKTVDWLQWRQQILKWFIIFIILSTVLLYFGFSLWLVMPIITIAYFILLLIISFLL